MFFIKSKYLKRFNTNHCSKIIVKYDTVEYKKIRTENMKRIANNFGSLDVVFKKGKESFLFDTNNKRYIDFVSGIGVNILGHNNKKIVHTIKKQAKKQIHISNYYNSDIGLLYAKNLLSTTNMNSVFFANSGAEANEAAIKLARKYQWLKKQNQTKAVPKKIITLKNSFHGRSLASLTATGQDKYHPECFAPYVDGFEYIEPMSDVEAVFDDSVCAFMFECVQGEGGVHPLEKAWLQKACTFAQKKDILVIVDEVQTGMGRCGKILASQLFDIKPDIISLAKGIAGGIPMGACVYSKKLADVFVAGDHQSTFGGNPLACAVANTILQEINTPEFMKSVTKKGTFIQKTIETWQLKCVHNIRGLGLMIGFDIDQSALDIQKKCLEHGLCISTAGANTIRFLPPLNITKKQITEGLITLKKVLQQKGN